jgi:hypothetical protein
MSDSSIPSFLFSLSIKSSWILALILEEATPFSDIGRNKYGFFPISAVSTFRPGYRHTRRVEEV